MHALDTFLLLFIRLLKILDLKLKSNIIINDKILNDHIPFFKILSGLKDRPACVYVIIITIHENS